MKQAPVGQFVSSLVNPFAAYAAGFLLALGVYSLGYSDLYPPLRSSLKWFLLGTCFICLLLAFFIGRNLQHAAHPAVSIKKHLWIFLTLMSVFAVEVVLNGGIPLVQATGDDYVREFGIPVIHVAFFGCCQLFTVFWYDQYLLSGRRTFLVFTIAAISTSLLAVSRGGFIITLIAIVVVYIQRRGLSGRLLLSFACISGAGLWGFGYLGDIRTHGVDGESIILSIGQASDKFRNSAIPTELFWPYLYTSSPLANLELNVTDRVATNSPGLYVGLELFPDFVSKRIVSEEDTVRSLPLLITDQLNVVTMYGRSFALMGWIGVWLSFSYFVLVSVFCLKALEGSKYLVSTIGILSSIAFLGIFDNMFIASGGILQVIIAVLLKAFEPSPLASISTSESNGVGSAATTG